ncbi:hypothetical protein C3L33_22799, partial [Rhododendron williamsianum]
MEGFLRRRDLPGFCRVDEVSDPLFQIIKTETGQTPRAQAVILKNTFENLEGPVLSHIRTRMPNLFTIGPLHVLKSRISEEKTTTTSPMMTASGILSRDQFMEFWYGLVNSGQHFLLVMRPDSIAGKDGESRIPAETLEGTKERGYHGGVGYTGRGL